MRKEIENDNNLELVTGGKLKYDNGKIWEKSNPGDVYHYNSLSDVADFLKQNWTYPGTYDHRALEMLKSAGLIWK